MKPGSVRVLSNVSLPTMEGYSTRNFGDYPGGAPAPYQEAQERRSLARILAEIPRSEQPDVLVLAHPEYLALPVDLDSFRGPKILLITDWNVCLRFLPDLCSLFDYAFTDLPGCRILEAAGVSNVRHQPLFGHDPGIFHPLGLARDLDLSFCGNLNGGMHGERNRLLFRLARWGAGRALHLDQAFGAKYVEILGRSRLVFNWAIRGEANMRLYEAMACGAVPLVEEGNVEVPLLFREGVHYFGYAPGGLVERVESLLAQPERIAEVSRAAQAEVAGHTRASQIRALLDVACRDAGRAAPPDIPGTAAEPPVAARKALIKMRVMGAGYTIEEALTEVRSQAPGLPGLDVETFPALLLSVLEKDPDKPLEATRSIIRRYLDHPSMPLVLRHYLGMRLARSNRDWDGLRIQCAELERILDAFGAAVPAGACPANACFHSPVQAAHALNGDLNRAFAQDASSGIPAASEGRAAYADLLRAHCHEHRARAALAQGRLDEALEQALRVPRGRWPSADGHGILVEASLLKRDREKLLGYLYEWFADRPMDSGIWNRGVSALLEIGDRRGLADFLAEVLILADHFLRVNLQFSRK